MTNRFKRLDLINREPEELWMEVCNLVQEEIKTIPKKKKCKKAKWLFDEDLQIAVNRRKEKGPEVTVMPTQKQLHKMRVVS